MIAFASYVDSVPGFKQTFSDWLKVRREFIVFVRSAQTLKSVRRGQRFGSKPIWYSVIAPSLYFFCLLSQVMFLRKSHGSRLNVFAPVNDLSLLSRSGAEDKSLVAGQKNDVEIAGGQLLGDEYSDHVVKVRLVRM